MTYHKNMQAFGNYLKRLAMAAGAAAAKEKQKTAARLIWQKVHERTPVDTGEARGGWNASLNAPDYSTTGELAPTESRDDVLERVLAELDAMPLGTTIHIANGTEHIRVLEDGNSEQAPEGILNLALHETREAMKR